LAQKDSPLGCSPMNCCRRAIIFLVLLLCSVAGTARADNALILRDSQQSYPVNAYLALLEDPGATLHIKDVLAGPAALAFRHPDKPPSNFGFSASAFWVRFDVVNRHTSVSDWLLEFQYPLIDRVDLYIDRADGRLETASGGDSVPFSRRAVKHRFPMFKITLAPGERASVYLRVRSDGAVTMPLMLRSMAEVQAHDHDEQYLLGIYYGILLAMLIYNVMLYLSVRDANYLYYALYIGAWTMMQLTINGLTFEYLWPNQPQLANPMLLVSLGATIACMAQFASSFLDIKRHFPRLAIVFRLYVWMGVAVAGAAFFVHYSIVNRIGSISALSGALAIFVAGILSVRQGGSQARFFMLGWTMLLLGAIMYLMQNAGLIPTVFITEYGLQIGSALEVLLFSFALAHRMKLLQEENIRIEREAAETLERRVQQRTEELDGALCSLSDAHQRLKDLSRIDSLTGIKNRASFNEQIRLEWQRGMRDKRALALLVIDIDHFKRINDTFGHLSGDVCLKEVAHVLAHQLHRASDDAFRFGGEEFVVLLPGTDLDGARHIGEQLRAAVEALCVALHGARIPLSISVGVAAMLPLPGTPLEALFGSADKALYQAKDAGRNRVCCAAASAAPAPFG
jgi:diguanylate cyclase (GGDEF)-like protein